MCNEIDTLIATTLRMLAADAVQQANAGHPGLPLGMADVATVLWTRFLKHNPADPTWPDRDRFILSAGHGSMLLYGLLHLAGYPLSLDDIQHFRQWASPTPGHPERDRERGIETTTGPLGQGLGNAVGLALAERWLAARFNKPGFDLVDHYTYVIASDGDMMEGISHEAASLAGHLGLSKLIVLYDDNGITIDGPTSLSFSDDVAARFAAYHWHTQQVDGHNMAAVDAAVRAAQAEAGRPSLILCRTHIGYRSPLQDTAKVHGQPLGEDNLRLTKETYSWPQEPRFYVPPEVYAYWAGRRGELAGRQAGWQALLDHYRQAYPDLAAQWDLMIGGELPPGWETALPAWSTSDKPLATRAASGQVLDALAPRLPMLLGGSADLTPSNNTRPKDARPVSRDDFGGTYIHFGIREHAMAGILSGLAIHGGIRPYGGTFLVFSDYMRPAIRLAAMMGAPVIYVFTHDTIGLGEDGPTHQPTEQMTALRAIPNLLVIRPADANETAHAWRVALEQRDGPTALILTRQSVPHVTPADNGLARGAYILADAASREGAPLSLSGPGQARAGNVVMIATGSGIGVEVGLATPEEQPDLVLIATGSEVSLALDARRQLAGEGITARVVSMPSWELFDAQPADYRAAVLPNGVPRLAIEAGVTLAWPRYVGLEGDTLGLDRYGASGPYKILYQQLGITVDAIVARAKALVK
jgi:transketolase